MNGDDEPASEEQSRERARRAYALGIKLLGARDHSSAELTRKLERRDIDETAIRTALAELRAAGYVDDERYARLFAEQLLERGRGPMAIRAKLRERGIDGELVADALEALGADWVERAEAALGSRFAPEDIVDDSQRSQARVARFLQGRGFGAGDALRALDRARRRIELGSLVGD